ncbi:glycosyltransferase [Flavobacterium sp. 7A]|uniref:glycosyltransferase n=1 Tax=Flavobacterium sp. 7A TaxID=2940571 RepID=UPI002227D8C3|nr:glycosyltransferase [Flavobacterium sp. 7A]MCW2120589.1 N-acetylgalactosamine-N,N'-diacetylbacillosaminyl-diphospho-undecaprenol 4-alpha-N-acetylgalactosaminyltransferase [Flavobacterium sp. 7A]
MNFSPNKKLSICIVGEELATGGAERCAAQLSIFLERNNCYVHHVISIDKVEYEYAGKLLNLGIPDLKKGYFHRLKRFWIMYQFFQKNTFDYIIDARTKHHFLQELIITKFIYNAPLIIWVHSYMTYLYFPKSNWKAKFIYNKSLILSVSSPITTRIKELYGLSNLETISNPLDLTHIEEKSFDKTDIVGDYILAVGRMKDNIKQFDVLIDCYSKTCLPNRNVKLVLLGDGKLRKELQNQVRILGIENLVEFKGLVDNPFKYFRRALFSVLTSKYEGFSMVLAESLACGTPVVSFDCLSGPSEIIIDKENGLLVENQNGEALIDAMNTMITDTELYANCKLNAKTSISRFSIDKIGKQWLTIFKNN